MVSSGYSFFLSLFFYLNLLLKKPHTSPTGAQVPIGILYSSDGLPHELCNRRVYLMNPTVGFYGILVSDQF
jgi:hypothetical protein